MKVENETRPGFWDPKEPFTSIFTWRVVRENEGEGLKLLGETLISPHYLLRQFVLATFITV